MGQGIGKDDVLDLLWKPAPSVKRAKQTSRNAAMVHARYHSRSSGRTVNDDYKVDSQTVLGRGSHAKVVLAHGVADGRKYALKTLQASKNKLARERLAMLAEEVEICLVVDHPNIVRVHDVYETDHEVVYVVMECCSGGELFSHAADDSGLAECDAALAVRQMLRAVGYLHGNNIVHRDLKPENFLFESKQVGAPLKLIDFGFAHVWNRCEPMMTCCGSLQYVSPEVLAMKGYDEKCDIWSLGVISFLLLTGMPPFFASTEREMRRRIRAGRLDWSGTRDVPADAVDFVSSLLARKPEDRPSASLAIFHPWLVRTHSGQAAASLSLFFFSAEVIRPMTRYARAPRLRRVALQLLAQHLPAKDTIELSEAFLALDHDNVGSILVEDLKDAIRRSTEGQECDLRELYEGLDSLWGERLSHTDFVAATLELRPRPRDDDVLACFRRLDIDRSGAISVWDLQRALGGHFEGAISEGVVREAHCEGRAEMDPHAFNRLFERYSMLDLQMPVLAS